MTAPVRRHEWQGSPDWHEYRNRMGNASELGALMNCAPWFPHTPYELWLFKTGRVEKEEHEGMRRGLLMEPKARAFIEQRFDEVYEPQVVARERISASLDGLSFDGRTLIEIKCPLLGRESEVWQHVAKHGTPPEHYWWQVQQQLYCAGAELGKFVVCHSEGGEIVDCIVCELRPDPQAHSVLEAAWGAFFEQLDADEAPGLTDRDVLERRDAGWRDVVAEWKEAKKWLEEAKRAEAQARAQLLNIAGAQSVRGAGVKVTRYWRRGEVDWRKATEGMDLEPYRKDGGWQYRISEQE